MTRKKPVVLCFSGHDPCGGAGIQADIEAINRHQCQATTIITALTLQNSCNVYQLIPQSAHLITQQAELLASDFDIDVIKIGLIGDHEIALAIKQFLTGLPNTPVIFDPVLAAGGGANLSNLELLQAIDELLPLTTLITPNHREAQKLAATQDNNDSEIISRLNIKGCRHTLITGADQASDQVINRLYQGNQHIRNYSWPRLPYTYHGSGCTLASSIAALIAKKQKLEEAILQAQDYTWNCLQKAYKPGRGQYLPDRQYC